MVKKHGKKQRARQKSRRTGAAYASAAAGTTHEHTPLPNVSALEEISYLPPTGFVESADTDLAARLVAACRAGCQPCQRTLSKKVLAHDATLLGLTAAIYGELPAGPAASAVTQAWAQLAHAAEYDMGDAPEALDAFEALNAEARSELLKDALHHWAV
ncbi:hypothetical protein ACFVFF_38860 [Streptomyces sp. NPDC057680]|uniref:hypothetical protein n=1 Tax=Streptomyces sp. NPDC057680 TaxID=3346208 RepID=UPI00369BFC29